MKPGKRAGAVLLALACSGGCGDSGPLADLFRSDSPHEQYLETLRGAGLTRAALGRDWESAAARALTQPVTARVPFRETGYFASHTPAAVAYRFELRRGRTLTVEVRFESERPARLFVDLFRLADGDSARRVASLPDDTTLMSYDVRRDGSYLLRLQPELLSGGRYTLVERTQASLRFPLPELNTLAVRSRFGVPRDAGRRSHQGVDIFARRGTPVVAVADGMARPATNELGGNVVWLYDGARGRTYYYAHLDRWALADAAVVRAGDTVGFVGNTGNARTTPPHLHFGVYDGGAVDPLPFLEPDDPAPPRLTAPLDHVGTWVRVLPTETELRSGPHRGAATLALLTRGSLASVSGVSQRAFRVRLPDASEGYVDARAVIPADNALRREPLAAGTILRESPSEAAPTMEVLAADTHGELLGRFGDFALVRLPSARMGWIETARGER